jgi:predicted anti-sigma-YlaC factor YlaD
MTSSALPPLSCDQADAFISDGLDGPLTPEQQDALDAHLQGCAHCVAVMQNSVTLHVALAGIGRQQSEAALPPLASDTVARMAAETRRRFLADTQVSRKRRTS